MEQVSLFSQKLDMKMSLLGPSNNTDASSPLDRFTLQILNKEGCSNFPLNRGLVRMSSVFKLCLIAPKPAPVVCTEISGLGLCTPQPSFASRFPVRHWKELVGARERAKGTYYFMFICFQHCLSNHSLLC